MTANTLEAAMWEFPILENIEENLIDSYQIPDKSSNDKHSITDDQGSHSNKGKYLTEDEFNKLNLLRNEYETKIKLINNIFVKVTEISNHLDAEVINILDGIIRSSVKKIILREISFDSKIIADMIDALKSLLDHDQEYLTIHVSPTDYLSLSSDDTDNVKNLKEDKSLNSGDIIVKSKYGEVRAIIDERINELIRISND